MKNVILADGLMREIVTKLGLDHVRRIILDLPHDGVATIYVEFLADERMYEIDFSNLGLEVKYKECLRGKDGKAIDVTSINA